MNVTQVNFESLMGPKNGASILIICPTRQRAKKAERMIKSYCNTATPLTDIVFWVDNDDHQLEEYKELFEDDIPYIIGYQSSITFIYNHVSMNVLRGYPIYHCANDDFVYLTNNFDIMISCEVVKHGEGIYYGDDGNWGRDLPTAPFVTSEWIKALGWLQLPNLQHLYNDMVLKDLAEETKRLHYIEKVKIYHEHHEFKKSIDPDETSKRVNSKDMYNRDFIAYHNWKKRRMMRDVRKLEERLNGLI